MTQAQVSALLGLISGFDRRTSGPDDDLAWAAAAEVGGWTFDLAKRAVVEHYTVSREWIYPADVTRQIREIRLRLHESFVLPSHPPELIDDNPEEFVAWARQRKAEHMASGLRAWADSGAQPSAPALEA